MKIRISSGDWECICALVFFCGMIAVSIVALVKIVAQEGTK